MPTILNIIFEARPYVADTGPKTIRMASAYADDTGTQLDGQAWEPLIVSGPTYSFNYTSDQNGLLTDSQTDLGTLRFRMGDFYDNEEWSTYDWNNASCRIWIGELGKPFSAYRKLYEATTSGLERDGVTATVALRALHARLERPLLNRTYAGTGGAAGPTGMKGKVKPIALGTCLSVEPVIVDAARWIYQVHGYGAVQDISAVYDFAQPLAAPVASVQTYQELADLTLTPGQWAKCNPLGMFRLGGASDKKISADVQGGIYGGQFVDSVADIVPAILREAGFSSAQIGPFTSLPNKGWSYYGTSEATVGEVSRKAVLDAGGYLFTDNQGVWQVGNAFAIKPVKPLLSDGSAEPSVGAIKELNVADPLYQFEVGYDPCWGVHSDSDISPKLLELAGTIAEQDAALEAIRDTADLAKAQSDAAAIEIGNMVSDGVLDRSEKVDLQTDLEEAAAQRREIASKIGAYLVGDAWNVYVAAHDALIVYVNGLSPSITDISVSTPVDRATFRVRWSAYHEAHQAVLNAMTGDARTVSTWTGVTGAGKPEDNATVGAPDGTDVAGKPATELVADTADAKGKANAAVDALKDGSGVIIKASDLRADIAGLKDTYGSTANADAARKAAEAARDTAKTHADNSKQASDQSTAARDAAQRILTDTTTQSGLADQAKKAAEAARDAAQQSKGDASGFATTASGQATIAKQEADRSGASATLAKGDADRAATKAGEASTSAGKALTSEQNAEGSKNSAETFSKVAATTTAQTYPSDFSQGAKFWAPLQGDPATVELDMGGREFITDPIDGPLMRITNPGIYRQTRNRALIPNIAGRRYRVEARVRVKKDGPLPITFVIGGYGLGANFTDIIYNGHLEINGYGYAGARTVADGWTTIFVEFTGNGTTCPWLAPSLYMYSENSTGAVDPGNCVVEYKFIKTSEVTESAKAGKSADASATSAANAKASETKSGQSAEAADGSRVAAQTAKGAAEAAQSKAATSENNAAGSASSAAAKEALAASTYRSVITATGNEQFNNGIDGWTNGDGIVGVSSSYGRSNVARTPPGSVYVPIIGRKVPVTSSDQRFLLRSSIRCAQATSVYYVGAIFYDGNDNIVAATDGTGNYPLGPSFELRSAVHGWLDREVVIGKGVTEASPYGGTRAIPASTVYFRPCVFINYTYVANSVTELDYFTVEDVTAQQKAATSANAASISEKNAAASETVAGQKASAASGSADTASTKAGEASGAASRAAVSESNAAGSSNSASSSATLSAASKSAAEKAALATHPTTFEDNQKYWSLPRDAAYDSSAGAYVVTNNDPGSYYEVHSRWTVPHVPGKRWKIRALVKADRANASILLRAYGHKTADILGPGSTGSFYTNNTAPVPQGAFSWVETIVDAPTSGDVHFLAVAAYPNYPNLNAVVSIAALDLIDVSETEKAAGSASAAAGSAATASTKASEAGQSASAANQSKLDAQVANGNSQSGAQTATQQAAIATAQAAAATANSLISASFASTRGLTRNGTFEAGDSGWNTGGLSYGNWYQGAGYRTPTGVYGNIAAQDLIKVDTTRRYRLNAKITIHGPAQTTYAGLTCYDVNKQFLGNIYMPQLIPTRYPGGSVLTIANDYTGTAGTAPVYGHGDFFVTGTVYVQPIALLNYPDPQPVSNGITDIAALYLEDVTEQKNAAAQASIAASQAATATAQAAAAQASAVLSASLSGGSINRNSVFADYPAGLSLPPQWNSWNGTGYRTYGNGDLGTPGTSIEGSPWGYYQHSNGQTNEAGIYQDTPGGPGNYVVSASVQVRDGAAFSGSGVLVYGLNSSGGVVSSGVINFAVDKDIAGIQWGRNAGAGTTAFRWSKLITLGGTGITTVRIYAMTNWSGFDGGLSSKGLSWLKCSYRAASDMEVKSGKIDGLEARVSTNEGAIATANGKLTAWSERSVTAGGATATVIMKSTDANGVATSDIALAASRIALLNTETGGISKGGMVMSGGNAVFDGSITANGGILVGNGKLKVQVQAQDYAVSHGQRVDFGYDLGRAPNITFGPCPVALNNGEVYAPYASDVSATGFTAQLVINSAPQSSGQSTGAFANQGNNTWDGGKQGKPNAASGTYTLTVNLQAAATAYREYNEDYR